MPLDFLFLASLAAAPAAAPPGASAPPPVAIAPVQVAVRIVSGARITLGRSADAEGYLVSDATVRLEDGSRRPARLVEFQ